MTRICCLTLAFFFLAGPGLAGDRETAKEAITRIQEAAARPSAEGLRKLFTKDAFDRVAKNEADTWVSVEAQRVAREAAVPHEL